VALTMLSVVGVILWGATQYGGLFHSDEAVTAIVAALTLLFAGPWIVAAIGSDYRLGCCDLGCCAR
jgi:type IV secretory pathway VirB2 component (pilin)